ncbi:hypothetical protein SDC9_56554 [bioreactor metagenome]|uniref:Uncharacterized protein n=1 Tax=bioreactor metagenome TaxID=1076179 RepID=A0A644X279_9ZZZZ
MGERLGYRQISVVEGDILSHQSDANMLACVLGTLHHGPPLGKVGGPVGEPQPFADHMGETAVFQHQRYLVKDGGGEIGNHILGRQVAEERNLPADILGNGILGAAEDHVRLNAQGQKLLGRVLRGLALELRGTGNIDDQ